MLPDKRTGAEESHAIERKTEDPAGCGPSKGFSEYARHGLAGHFWCEFVLSISIASYQLLRMVGALAAHLRRSFGLVTWVGGIKVRELFFFDSFFLLFFIVMQDFSHNDARVLSGQFRSTTLRF